MLTTEVKGATYRIGKMDALTQFHVARRVAPLLAVVGTSVKGSDGVSVIEPLAGAISRLSDADCDFVIGSCLGVVQRQQGNDWHPVWNAVAKTSMYADVDLLVMLQLTASVLQDNLGPFLPALPRSLTDAVGATPAG